MLHSSDPIDPALFTRRPVRVGHAGIKAAMIDGDGVDTRAAMLGGRFPRSSTLVADVRALSRVSAARSLRAFSIQWAVIALAATIAVRSGHPLVYLLAMLVIATRQHALGILVHDACHYRLFAPRALNDLLTDVLAAFHLGMTTSTYRRWHFPHHRYVNTDKDPEVIGGAGDPETWTWPNSRGHLAKILARDALGLSIPSMVEIFGIWTPWTRLRLPPDSPDGLSRREKITLFGFTAVLVGALVYFGLVLEYLVLWILPALTFMSAIFKFRSFAEHKGVPNTHELTNTRTVRPTRLERLLLAPCNVHYHLEHHLFPSVPFYNLPRLHRRLCRDPIFRAHAQLTDGYLDGRRGVLHELTT